MLILVITIIVGFLESAECQDCNSTALHRLKNTVFCGYDSSVRPVKFHKNTTTVNLSFIPRYIDFEEKLSIAYALTWVPMSWTDEYIRWNPKDYDNIEYLHVKPDEIWMPDLSVYNRRDLEIEMGSPPAVVMYNGKVYAMLIAEFISHCSMDLRYWPHDEHTCTATLGSKSYVGTLLNFVFSRENATVGLKSNLQNRIWELKEVTVLRNQTNISTNDSSLFLVTIQYSFRVKRHSSGIVATVFVPIFLLVILVLFSFWVSHHYNRVTILILAMAGHISYLQYLGNVLPHNAESEILIVSFIRDSLVMTVCECIIYIWTESILESQYKANWISVLTRWIEKSPYTALIFVPTEANQGLISEEEVTLVKEVKKYKIETLILVNVVNKLLFFIYVIIYGIMILCFF